MKAHVLYSKISSVAASVVFLSLLSTARSGQRLFSKASECPEGSRWAWPCLREIDGSAVTLRVMYMDKPFVVTNPAAQAKVASLGRSYLLACDDPAMAVPECFDFENWNGGWIGSYMHQVLKDLNVTVVAMTRANFSEQAMNVTTDSSFTRCVWELNFRNIDLCVGSFW
jgi:hypothetical protein